MDDICPHAGNRGSAEARVPRLRPTWKNAAVTWTALLAPSLFAAALLFLPGLLISLTAGLRGFVAIGMAPILSVTAIAGGAVGGGILGIPWGWWTPALISGLLSAGVLGVRALLDRRGWGEGHPTAGLSRVTRASYWIGWACSIPLMARHLRNVLGAPDAFSQTYDNIFHLSAIRFIVDTGDASSLTLGRLIAGPVPMSFYPAAFHGTAALTLQTATPQITIATNAVLAVLVVLVWPLACLTLARLALPANPAAALGTAIAAASFPAFPVLLLDFGVLYPNLMGLALLPVALGLVIRVLGLGGAESPSRVMALVLLAVAGVGLALSHPNTVVTLLAIAVPPVLAFWISRLRPALHDRRAGAIIGWFLALVTALGAAFMIWRLVRPPAEAATWPPLGTVPTALGEAILNAPAGTRAAWVPSALMVVGLLLASRARRWWLAGSWLVLVGLWLVVAGFAPSNLRTFLTGNWYNDPWRFAATLPTLAVPLAALGFEQIVRRSTLVLVRASRRARRRRRELAAVLTVLALVITVATTQRSPAMNAAVEKARSTYELRDNSPLLTRDEFALIMRLPEHVPADAVIATNPWNGSSLAYALTGLRTTTTHVSYVLTPDLDEVNQWLDEATDVPAACDAAHRLDVRFALDFGTQEVHGGTHPYPGLQDLAGAAGFREVDRQGAAVLYELVRC